MLRIGVKKYSLFCHSRLRSGIQTVNYLVATDKPIDLLLNFGEREVEVKRKTKEIIKED